MCILMVAIVGRVCRAVSYERLLRLWCVCVRIMCVSTQSRGRHVTETARARVRRRVSTQCRCHASAVRLVRGTHMLDAGACSLVCGSFGRGVLLVLCCAVRCVDILASVWHILS